jgi:hypothetical protein
VFVHKEGGQLVTLIGRESPGTDSSILNAGPGSFFLDILAANTNYVVTVEDCTGAPPGGPGEPPEQPPGRVDSPEGVMQDTQVRKIPNTGDPPYLAVGALVFRGAALIVGRGVLKR